MVGFSNRGDELFIVCHYQNHIGTSISGVTCDATTSHLKMSFRAKRGISPPTSINGAERGETLRSTQGDKTDFEMSYSDLACYQLLVQGSPLLGFGYGLFVPFAEEAAD